MAVLPNACGAMPAPRLKRGLGLGLGLVGLVGLARASLFKGIDRSERRKATTGREKHERCERRHERGERAESGQKQSRETEPSMIWLLFHGVRRVATLGYVTPVRFKVSLGRSPHDVANGQECVHAMYSELPKTMLS